MQRDLSMCAVILTTADPGSKKYKISFSWYKLEKKASSNSVGQFHVTHWEP